VSSVASSVRGLLGAREGGEGADGEEEGGRGRKREAMASASSFQASVSRLKWSVKKVVTEMPISSAPHTA
jgi:hypothetical protein